MKFLKISNIKLNIDESVEKAYDHAIKIAGLKPNNILEKKIIKRSIDARKKDSIKILYTIGIYVKEYTNKRKNVEVLDSENKYTFTPSGTTITNQQPIVVGFGPAGMFTAYMLALYGYKPIIIERGSKVEDRINKVESFWNTGKLDKNTNVQFGEGGAGTFSDGKLNTGIKDKENRIKFVLETFVKFGANENILYDSKPHIGTDILANVVVNMRKEIESLDGCFMFDTTVVDFIIDEGKLTGVVLDNGQKITSNICILAIGHSARDTFSILKNINVKMEQKPFAVGIRIEHLQNEINENQYGFKDNRLGAADYKLTYQSSSGRGVYSFCMCPGGYVVNSSSEAEHLAINGMSYNARDSKNANSALVVTITPNDFKSNDVLAGISFQRNLEKKAYVECDGKIPIQKYIDFKENVVTKSLGKVKPQMKGAYDFGNLNNIFPDYICKSLCDAIDNFSKVIKDFNHADTLLSAVESRTSSPVRILRDESMQSNIKGLYPAGEGAGYAGGITSAAIDGIKIFETIAKEYSSF